MGHDRRRIDADATHSPTRLCMVAAACMSHLKPQGGSSPSRTAAEANASTKALKQTITRESENFVAPEAYTRCSRKAQNQTEEQTGETSVSESVSSSMTSQSVLVSRQQRRR